MNMNRGGIWSEHQRGRLQSTEDVMSGVGLGVDSLEVVMKRTGPHGVECTYDCARCGRQTRMITPFPELAFYYTGQKVKGATPTNQGIVVAMRCRCRFVNRMLWSWAEVDQHVREAVRLRRLPGHLIQGR